MTTGAQAPIRVAVLNDYPLEEALRMVDQGTYPAQHTWGASLFEQLGVSTVLVPFYGNGMKSSLRSQWRLVRTQACFDVVYAACQSETWLLSRLRRLGLFRRPIVMVVHHPISGRLRGGRMLVNGHDRLLFLSRLAFEHALRTWPEVAPRSEVLSWGVDLNFYDRQPAWPHAYGDNYFVSAGKANRDHQLLANCASKGQHRTLIVSSADTRPERADPRWVTVVSNQSGHALNYGQLTSVYRSSRAVVIPMQHVDGLAGLTSLLDAMACGKPVIMTRNASVDIDIEALGFGIWVAPQDENAMQGAMDKLASDDELVRRMGLRARAYAEDAYRYDVFAKRVVAYFKTLARADRGGT